MTHLVEGLLQAVLKRRARFPRLLNRAIDAAVDHMPDVLWRRLSPLGRSAAAEEIPPAFVAPLSVAERVAIGPVNYSGQGNAWARELERRRPDCWAHAFAVEVPGGFSFQIDTEVPQHVHASSRLWQDAQLAALSRCTHVLVEAERPLLGRRFRDFEAEARELRSRGVSVAFLAHGTDIRVPSEHVGTTPWSHYADADFYSGREETVARRNIEALRRLGGPVFVSTPDLLTHLPEAEWCPVVVDPSRWFIRPPASDRDRIVVAHAPSNAKLKGTDLIEPVLWKLHGEGVIEYRPLTGIPSAEMPEVYADADVVLDQFRLGSYGVAACESMAAGRVVVGHLTGEVREVVKGETGLDCPIVEATPATLETVLRHLAASREERVALGQAGKKFVGTVHDGRMSTEVLGEHWLDAVEVPHASRLETPEVDVVIATHTPERPIARAVASALYGGQTPVRVTVVVHNTDAGPIREALVDYLEDPRLRIIEFVDGVGSPAGPMNRGLEVATAKYTSLLGSDDEFAQGALDTWVHLADKHRAGAVIARIDFADGQMVPQPPVRPGRRELRDPVKDRLAYRSAPLGLIATEHFGSLRLEEGLQTGEDISYSARVWFSGQPIVFSATAQGYTGHRDGDDRVTMAPRPVNDELAFVSPLVSAAWFRELEPRAREAIVVKLLRVQVIGSAGARAASELPATDRASFARVREELKNAAPRAEERLSRAELALLRAVSTESSTAQVKQAASAWKRRATLAGVLTPRISGVFHAQAPLRYGVASLLLARRRLRSSQTA